LLLGNQILLLQSGGTGIDDHIRFIIDDLLKILCGHTECVSDLCRKRSEVPDVDDRHCKGDMPHPFPPDALLSDFHAAPVADDAAVADPFVLPAMAFPIPYRSKDFFAEQPILLRPERPIVDGFRFRDFTM
jgi:hypothetical protein